MLEDFNFFIIFLSICFCSCNDDIAKLSQPIRPKNFYFPSGACDDQYRSFKENWFRKYSWIHYDIAKDEVLCCVESVRIQSFSGPHFPAFGLNRERYGVSLCVQSECGKIRTRKTPNTDTFEALFCFLCIKTLSVSNIFQQC